MRPAANAVLHKYLPLMIDALDLVAESHVTYPRQWYARSTTFEDCYGTINGSAHQSPTARVALVAARPAPPAAHRHYQRAAAARSATAVDAHARSDLRRFAQYGSGGL